MAVNFTQASTEYYEVDATPITGVPMTVSGWMYPTDTGTFKTCIAIVDKDVADNWMVLYLDGSDRVVCGARQDGDNSGIAVTTATYTANAWNHVAGVWSAADARASFLHGANKATNAVSKTPAGLDRFSIGRHGDSTPGTYMQGRIAEVGVWNVALSDGEIALLGRGISPLRIRPQSLVLYYPLFTNDATTPNLAVGGTTYALARSSVGIDQADHAPVMPPFAFAAPQPMPTAAAPGGRTTRNTRSHPLGIASGMGFGIGRKTSAGLYVPDRVLYNADGAPAVVLEGARLA